MSLTGGSAKLDGFILKLEELASPTWFRRLGDQVAEEMRQLVVNESFGAESDPYGGKWPALKRRRKRDKKGGKAGKILQDTGKLRSSIHSIVEADTVIVGTNLPYATFHQHGTNGHSEKWIKGGGAFRNQPVNRKGKFQKKSAASRRKEGAVKFRAIEFKVGGGAIPARPFLPTASRGLPDGWREAIAKIVAAEMGDAWQ